MDVSAVASAADPASVGLKHSPKPSKVAADCNSRPWSTELRNSFPFQFSELIAPANRAEDEIVSRWRKTVALIDHSVENGPSASLWQAGRNKRAMKRIGIFFTMCMALPNVRTRNE